MYARKVVPFLLIAGAVMMIMRHRYERAGECGEHKKPGPIGLHTGLHGEWGKRVPPMFDKWHQRAHAPEQQAQPAASALAI